ncbi:MAG: hypothetical protein FE78DRAFT_40986 [Acidomyces sp. 'richmondensis']|nr:MAG: hypothetical protein FE78DRAFT_40986 [Acidomyces sp. 'richmondensis']
MEQVCLAKTSTACLRHPPAVLNCPTLNITEVRSTERQSLSIQLSASTGSKPAARSKRLWRSFLEEQQPIEVFNTTLPQRILDDSNSDNSAADEAYCADFFLFTTPYAVATAKQKELECERELYNFQNASIELTLSVSVFSKAEKMVTEERYNLKADVIEADQCLKTWLQNNIVNGSAMWCTLEVVASAARSEAADEPHRSNNDLLDDLEDDDGLE